MAEFLALNGLKLIVDRSIMSEGDIEAINRSQWEAGEHYLVSKTITPDDRILEIGTCIGYLSMIMGRIVGDNNIVTFEANAKALAVASINFEENAMRIRHGNALLMNRLLYAGANTVPFYVSGAIVSSSALEGHGKRTEVPALCLENEIIKAQANALVLDIEGSEVDLLLGADLSGINKIIMETHYRKAGKARTDTMVRYIINQGLHIDLALSKNEVVYFSR
jgi:FkbM family methyltransferase